jgi:hypothetical protein
MPRPPVQYVKPNFKTLFVCQWQIVTSCRMKNCGPCARQQQQPTKRSPVGAMASGSHNHTVSARFCGLRRHLFFLRFFPEILRFLAIRIQLYKVTTTVQHCNPLPIRSLPLTSHLRPLASSVELVGSNVVVHPTTQPPLRPSRPRVPSVGCPVTRWSSHKRPRTLSAFAPNNTAVPPELHAPACASTAHCPGRN